MSMFPQNSPSHVMQVDFKNGALLVLMTEQQARYPSAQNVREPVKRCVLVSVCVSRYVHNDVTMQC